MAPVDAFEQITHLSGGQRYDAVHRLRPNEAAAVQPLGIERQPKSIMPKRLKQRTIAATKHEDIARKRVTAEPFLHQQRQSRHTTAHVGVARRQPNPHGAGNRDHSRNAASTRRNAARFTSLPTRTCRPLPSSISITLDGAADRGPDAERWA